LAGLQDDLGGGDDGDAGGDDDDDDDDDIDLDEFDVDNL
jgi:hypothetical protein